MAVFTKSSIGLLAFSLLLTACGGEPGKVYPKNSSPNGQDGRRTNPEKPTVSSKYQTAHVSATAAIALFQLNRAIDLALKKDKAESFDASNDCQKIAPNTGSTIVQVETNASACRKSNSGSDWSGTERIELSGNSNGLFDSLTTTARTYALSLNTTSRDHDLEVKISITKASNSSPGNRITYDFTEELVIESRGEDKVVVERRRKIANDRETDDEDESSAVTRPRTSQKIKAISTVILKGQIEINKTTKALSGIRLEDSSIDVKRTITKGVSDPLETNSKLDLIPKSTTFSESVCGRIAADFGYNQSVTLPNGRQEDRNGTLNFATTDIKAEQSPTIRLATCKPGFKTLVTDLEVVANSLFKNFGN